MRERTEKFWAKCPPCGEEIAMFQEEVLHFWRTVQVEQGSVRRIKEAVEADLDPKNPQEVVSNKPSLNCEDWECISALAQTCQSHLRVLPLPLTCLSYNSRACAAQWGDGEGQVRCSSSEDKIKALTFSLTLQVSGVSPLPRILIIF